VTRAVLVDENVVAAAGCGGVNASSVDVGIAVVADEEAMVAFFLEGDCE
jgi:hypothetical protein